MIFPEDRMNPVKMKRDLPQRWIIRGPADSFRGSADRGENFAFQLGLYAHTGKLQNVKIVFSDFTGPDALSGKLFSCINTSGIGWDGERFEKKLDVEVGAVQPLWCTVAIPGQMAPGNYAGTATIKADGTAALAVTINLTITDKVAHRLFPLSVNDRK